MIEITCNDRLGKKVRVKCKLVYLRGIIISVVECNIITIYLSKIQLK